ncbi:MAG: hypothetical protein RL513_502 [Pseudomonadota bacterium]|jgi:hypothetical protein
MTLTMSDCHRCVWSRAQATVIDFIHPHTGLTVCFRQTLAEVRDRYPDAEEGEYEAIAPDLEAARRAKYVTKPQRITAEDYQEALNCLPPLHWRGGGGAETFKMSEFYTADLTHLYCKVGDRYWSFLDSARLTHDEIVRACLASEVQP